MADPIEIPAHVLQPMIEELVGKMGDPQVFQLGGRGHSVQMVANSNQQEAALRRIDALPGGFFVNFLGQLTGLPYPPPHEMANQEAIDLARRFPREQMRTTLQGGIANKLSQYRPDFHYIVAYLYHVPEPYLEGWRLNLASDVVSKVDVRVVGQMWE